METSRAAPPLARLSTARCGAPARPARGGHADTSHHNAQGARPRVRLRGVRVAPRVRHDTRSAVLTFLRMPWSQFLLYFFLYLTSDVRETERATLRRHN